MCVIVSKKSIQSLSLRYSQTVSKGNKTQKEKVLLECYFCFISCFLMENPF